MSPSPVPEASGDREPLPLLLRLRSGLARGWPYAPAAIPIVLTLVVVLTLVDASHLQNFGWSFFSFNTGAYGIGVFVLGSFLTSVPALALAMAIGLGVAISSTTYLPRWLSGWLDPFVDLLAGIPSIIYGLWGWLILAPFLASNVYAWSTVHLAWIPGLEPITSAPASPAANGAGLASGIVILTLMILPITTLLMRDALQSVPRDLWESGLALGATRWEVSRRVAIPYAKRGILGAAFLGFGRAIGETVAVAMVIGQAAVVPTNAYAHTTTMASYIISTFQTALEPGVVGRTTLHFLAELGLVLLAITLLVNLAGRWMIRRTFANVAGL